MKNNNVLKCLALGILSFGVFNIATFAKQEKVVEEAVAWSGTQTPSVDESYYESCEGKTGSALMTALSKFNQPKDKSYDWSRYEAADEAENDSTSILSIYTRHTIKKSGHCGDYAWDKWNREHVYTQTKFPNSKTDNHNIFACEGKINGIRSDDPFRQLDNVTTTVSVFGHDTGCKSSGGYFEPCDEAKGEIARACMYCTVYYGYDLTDIFFDVATCARWHSEHPVTDREIFRNNKVYTLQGNRNPFVDHPSYANSIYGATYTLPDPVGGSTEPAVYSVSLNKTTLSLDISGTATATLSASVHAVNGAAETVSWSTSDSSVATVENGVVTAHAVGTATIKATSTFNTEKFASCVVSVSDSSQVVPTINSVVITPTNLSLDLYNNKTGNLSVSVRASGGAAETVTWSSENANIATVDNGVVTAKAVGTTTIKATSTFDTSKSASCTVTVSDSSPVTPPDDGGQGGGEEVTPPATNNPLTSLEVGAPAKVSYAIGEKLDTTGMKAIAVYKNGSFKDVTAEAQVDELDSSSVGTRYIFVRYTEDGVTVVDGFQVTINNAQAESSSCSGSVIASSIIISTMSLLGAGLIFIKKRRKHEDK